MKALFVGVLVVACCGCSSDDGTTDKKQNASVVADCKAQFSPSAGYGWEDDLSSATSLPDGGSPPPGPSPLDRAVSDCSAAGAPASSCDAAPVMTHDAAICVAKGLGLSAGIAELKAGIVFHPEPKRIVWNVQNTLTDDGQGSASGQTMRLDAITGANLGTRTWGWTP